MSRLFISIVIAAGPKRDKELMRCLVSIYRSTYKHFEVIVVDNSCNATLSDHILKIFPFIRIIRLPINTGVFGFNVGFINAKGNYILALDDDAYIRSDSLKNIYTSLKKYPSSVGVIGCNSYNPKSKQYYHSHYIKRQVSTIYNQTIGGTVFKKDIFSTVGYYDQDFFCWIHEDDLFIRIRNAGYQIRFDPTIIVHHIDTWSTHRKEMYFYMFRNMIWFYLKHFSLLFIPLLLLRSMVTLVCLPFKKHSLESFFYGLSGYLLGLLTFFIPLKKRKEVLWDIQKEYVAYYLFDRFK